MIDALREPYALVFPGQGSQFVGMGLSLAQASPVAAETLREANEVLGFDLVSLMSTGPAETLEDTHNAQPAILALSVAVLRAVEASWGRKLTPAMVAGHSLGEFTALVAAEVLTYADALTLVRERGRIMKAAGETNPGAMAAVLGLDDDVLADICSQASLDTASTVVVANRNCPGQTVISGSVIAIEAATELAKGKGARRVARLGVSIASHSPLMSDAAAAFGGVVAGTPLAEPVIPVVANGSAQPMRTTAEIVSEITAQMAAPVNWTGSVETMSANGIHVFAEIGPGTVLAGLIKRIDREATLMTASDFDSDLPSGGK